MAKTVEQLDTELAEADEQMSDLEAKRDGLLATEEDARAQRGEVANQLRDAHNRRIQLQSQRDRLAQQDEEE